MEEENGQKENPPGEKLKVHVESVCADLIKITFLKTFYFFSKEIMISTSRQTY